MEYMFDLFLQDDGEHNNNEKYSELESGGYTEVKESLYISRKLFSKISKYLERVPDALRCSEICEEGWFNKKESYIRKRLKHNRKEGKYCLGVSHLHRSFNGKRFSRYLLYWLYERDIYFINKGMPLNDIGEIAPIDTLPGLYQIINLDQ